MNFPRLTVIPVDLSSPTELLSPVHRMRFLEETEIHLVHVVRKENLSDGLGLNLLFPTYEDIEVIKTTVINKLKAIAPEVLPYGHSGRVEYQCLFGFDPKKEFCHYLEGVKADLVLISSRAKHDILESSFAYYVTRHAQCSVLMLRS